MVGFQNDRYVSSMHHENAGMELRWWGSSAKIRTQNFPKPQFSWTLKKEKGWGSGSKAL